MTPKLLLACAILCAASANAQPNRLIAFAEYSFDNGTFKKTDTDRYYYSQDRSVMNEMSQADNPAWAADSIVYRAHDFTTGTDSNVVKTCQEFDGDSLLTVKHTLLWVNNAWDTATRGNYHYTTAGIDTFTLQNKQGFNWVPNMRYINEYGPDGITTHRIQFWNVGTNDFQDNVHSLFTYSGGQLTEEVTEFWNGSSWSPNTRQLYTYNGGNIATITNQIYSVNWENSYRRLYTYDGNNDMTEEVNEQWQSGAWESSARMLNTYDNNHNRLTETEQLWDSAWENEYLGTYQYNSYNLITSYATATWDATAMQFFPEDGQDGKNLYYYEGPASVNTVHRAAALGVYPNPASNTINIQSFAAQATPFSITIFDATGKSVKHWNEAPTSFYQKQIDISELPSGNYFLRIDNRPNEAARFTVIR